MDLIKTLVKLNTSSLITQKTSSKKWNIPYMPLRFSEIEQRVEYFANFIEASTQDLTNLLLRYESYEVAQDEMARTLDLLRNLKENKKYFQLRIGAVTAFLPRNQPLYAFSCFVLIPSLMASEVYFRIPHSMKGFFPEMLELLKIDKLFPNIIVSARERLDFLKSRSALLIDPKTEESKPVTDVVIFTGTSVHADRLRVVFDRRTLFITNGAGHNPVVISKDADLSKAIEAVLSLQLYNQGQDCAAPNAILLHKAVAKDFMDMLRENISNVKVGHYKDMPCRVGPLSDPKDLIRIQDFLIDNSQWLDPSTPGIIRTNDSIVLPTIIYKPLNKGGNFKEIFAPIIFVQEYEDEKELKLYFENKHYAQNAMYVTLYGTSTYVKNLIDRPILGKILHDRSTFIHNTHLHACGIERGTKPYGGYGYGASSISVNGKIIPMPTLPQRDIYKYVAEPLLHKKVLKHHKKKVQKFTKIQEKNVEKLLKLQSTNIDNNTQVIKNINDSYLDSHLFKNKRVRYVKIEEGSVFSILKRQNTEYIQTLSYTDIKLIRALKKLLKRKSSLSLEQFRTLLYSLPNELNNTKKNNLTRQRNFFHHIYQLLLGRKSGPQLASFLLDVEDETLNRLLDI